MSNEKLNLQAFSGEQRIIPLIQKVTVPLILCCSLVLAFTSDKPAITSPLILLAPVVGIGLSKLGLKKGISMRWPIALINGAIIIAVCKLSGERAPSLIIGFTNLLFVTVNFKGPLDKALAFACSFAVFITGCLWAQMDRMLILQGLISLAFYAVVLNQVLSFVLKQGVQIKDAKDEIDAQKQLIEEQQYELIDSINYAKRIQDAILPPLASISQKLPGSFVLYKPKDIVAGDFYWMEEIGDTIYIAAADCTGHGVPGAMVGVVCSGALNRAVKEFGISDTGKILDKVTDLVLETFEKSTADVKDGMDISLLSLNKSTKQIRWSGANNPLWYFTPLQNGGHELKEITADKQPIGQSDHRRPFTTQTIDYIAGSKFYLFTDGYADQFGGPKGKKFKYKQMQEKLEVVLAADPGNQKKFLQEQLESWQGALEQVDDICIIGLSL